jgi:hypothetical protein
VIAIAMKITMKKLMWMPAMSSLPPSSLGWNVERSDTRMWMPLPPLTSGNCWEPNQPMTKAPIA